MMLAYFILMRLYYAYVLHVKFDALSLGLAMINITLLFTVTVAVGQQATPRLRQDWLAQLGWKQWVAIILLAALLTPMITLD